MATTTVSDLGTAGTTAYEKFAYFALRPRLYFDRCADIKPTNQSHRGASVTFPIWDDLAPTVTPISESSDITPATLSDDDVVISINEYGNAVMTTAAVRGQSYLVVSEDAANVVGYNAGISFDSLARNPLVAGTNTRFAGGVAGPRNTLLASDILTAQDVRYVAAQLENSSVMPITNEFYKCFISPLVAHDLREETGPANWRQPHEYSQTREIWTGETGAFESFIFIHTPRLSAPALATGQGGPGGFVDGGDTNVDVHPTLFLGRQALAKTWAELVSAPMPQIILGEVVDTLRRFVPLGWYWQGGFGRFRENSLWRVESASSIGAN